MSDVVETMMPCAADGPPIGVEEALVLALQLKQLQRVPTDPGSNDLTFLKEMRGRLPSDMSPKQRAHIARLAWKYRWHLPSMLRPAADPDTQTAKEVDIETTA